MSVQHPVIALLGQPNSGKSTLFNGLTGSHQRVGNWPGKTVEQKEGTFTYHNRNYIVTDLPGSYSLSANSDEEIVTRDYISEGRADLVCILADASQLERSLYMLADFAGINAPVILLLNMMDVAKEQGKTIDAEQIGKRLGIPVVPFVAADTKSYDRFYQAVETALAHPAVLKVELIDRQYQNMESSPFPELLKLLPREGIGQLTPMWLAAKLTEGDADALDKVKRVVSAKCYQQINTVLAGQKHGALLTGGVKFGWIDQVLKDVVTGSQQKNIGLSRFDRAATGRYTGKPIAIGITILGLVLSMVIATPIMMLGPMVPQIFAQPLTDLLLSIHLHEYIIALLCGGLLNALSMTIAMVGFVFGITFVFGLIEEIGYMARISFVFDNTMSKLGLQGKAMMPFLVSIGCTIGGVAGTRVIDSWRQRLLTITLAWAVPCGATFVIIPTLASTFFGWGAAVIMILIFVIMVIHMMITAKIFGRKLATEEDRYGMIMELPPYHKPKWFSLLKYSLGRVWNVFKRAFKIIVVMTIIFWALSYSSDGDAANSMLYSFGRTIEPFTRLFGLSWQTFLAFVSSAISKEAVLGVLSALYTNSGSIFDSTMGAAAAAPELTEILSASISKPEALAFIFATTFNIPCVAALGSTYQETHSLKWTLGIALYYTVLALVISCIMYHIGVLIF